jgi:23S rRNA pseudoU1915 N3-methylase RlmH
MNGYELSRNWFDWCFENPEKINPNHSALYFFCIEHCNRLGWKEKFGLPTTMVMEAVGIKSYNTYIKTFNDLIHFGFIDLIEKSRNQHSSNIIALSKNDKALDKALDKATVKHVTKQHEKQVKSTEQSNCSIDKLITSNQEPITNKLKKEKKGIVIPSISEFMEYYKNDLSLKFPNLDFQVQTKYESWIENNWKDGYDKEIKNWKLKLNSAITYLKPINNGKQFTKPNGNEALANRLESYAKSHGVNQEQNVSKAISERSIFDDYEEIP